MTEDEVAGWHHRLNGPEFEKAPGAGVLQSMGSQRVRRDWATELNGIFYVHFSIIFNN